VRGVREGYLLATGKELPFRGVSVVGNAADLVGYGGIPAAYHGVNQTTAHSDDEFVRAGDLVRAARVHAAVAVGYLGEQL
jgi:acetylornithine deacetylase/succinyl-diaminopimelate desuccinylase-like protein